ncbi:MAG: replicative DNA helicase [Terriglobales bacterium]
MHRTHLNIVATVESTISRMPANIEAERSILGAILLDNHAYNDAAEHLQPDDFSLDSHRRIYARMMDLAESSRPVDIVTLVEELERKKELQAIGEAAYISSLLDGVPDRPSIEHYVRIVRDKAILRGLINVANATIAKASEQADPADEILSEAEAAVFQLSEKRIGKGFQGIQEIVRNSFGSVDALLQRGQRITGLETHYERLDELTSGLQKSDLVILAARPSMGKTSLAMNIAESAAIDDGKVVGIFSLEMSSEALLQRLLCSRAIVDAHKMRTGSLWKDDMQKVVRAMEELADAPLFIDDTPGISMTELRAKARRLKQAQGRLDLLVVDYLQLMSGGSKRFENRTQEVSAISRGLKGIAKELEVPVLALSQLSRAPESRGGDHRPQLSDLRESGSIEQDADVVMFIFRGEVYKPDDLDLRGKAEIIIAKQRNGPTDKFTLAFLPNSTRFANLERGNDESSA